MSFLRILPLFVALFLTSAFTTPVNAEASPPETTVSLALFYGQGCPHCAGMAMFLEELQQKHPELSVEEYEIYFAKENIPLFERVAKKYDVAIDAVPTVFIGEKSFVGKSPQIEKEIEKEVERCIADGCLPPLEYTNNQKQPDPEPNSSSSERNTQPTQPADTPDIPSPSEMITISAVVSAAIVDAINPCAFAVLIILITTILASGKKRRALFSGLAFSLSIFISYYLMGLGLYSALQASGLTHTFYGIIGVLALFIGLFNLKDYFWYGKWFVMEVPMSWRPTLKRLLKGVTSVPGAFLIGFVISLFLLPCTSGPYIVILGLLAHTTTKGYALTLLLLYNLIFVSPMILITGAVYFGLTTTEKAEEWRTKKLQTLHLIAGLIILGLGITMLGSLWLGYL